MPTLFHLNVFVCSLRRRVHVVALITTAVVGIVGAAHGAPDPRIYIWGVSSAAQQSYYKALGASEDVYILGQGVFNSADTLQFNRVAVQNWVQANVPPMFDGPLVVNWEGKWGCIMFVGPCGTCWCSGVQVTEAVFQAALAEGVALIELVRQLRPLAQVGYYNIPQRWSGSTEAWQNRATWTAPISAVSTGFYPSLYDSYRNPEQGAEYWDLAAAMNAVMLYLELANTHGDALVYPFISHRYRHSSYLGCLTYESEFYNHIFAVMNASWGKAKATGVVWPVGPLNGGYEESLACPTQPAGLWPPSANGLAAWSPCFWQEILAEEMPVFQNHANPTYPDDYIPWVVYRDWLRLRRLTIVSNIVYETNLPLPVWIVIPSNGHETTTSRSPQQNSPGGAVAGRAMMSWDELVEQGQHMLSSLPLAAHLLRHQPLAPLLDASSIPDAPPAASWE